MNEPLLESVASSILDGTAIDWPAIGALASAEERLILEELRLLSTVADIHRHPPVPSLAPAVPPNDDVRYWGRLRLIERAGGGSFGEVHRAWDPRLHREVALKLIRLDDVAPQPDSDELIREGRLLARVRHPGVVSIYDAEQIGNEVGLCMEFVEGVTLEARLRERGPFEVERVIDIGIQLCDALSAAHDAGVLHRDVKAANVIMKADGRVVLTDFGSGRHVDDRVTADPAGTPLYVAPEVLDGRGATAASDVYSLGVLLDHLLTGSYPVEARTLEELRAAHARRRPGERIAVTPVERGIPPRLASILSRATDPDPSRRHATAASFGTDLRRLTRRSPGRVWLASLAAASVLLAIGLLQPTWLGFAPRGPAAGLVAGATEPVGIAIFPFAVSGDEDDEVLQAGVTRDVIARLQAFENVRIISADSAFRIASMNIPVQEVGARLRVVGVVTGTLAPGTEAITATVQLARAADGHVLWKQEYTRPATATPEIPRAIALDLAGALGLRRDRAVGAWRTRNPEAFALYVRARTEFDKFTRDGYNRALKLLQAALAADEHYAEAHAVLAQTYLTNMIPVDATEALARAEHAAARAMALDPELPETYVAAAYVKSSRADWIGAERDYEQAIELGPSNVLARQEYSHWLSRLGYFDRALEQARMAVHVDPYSPRAILAVASALRFARRFEEAIDESHKAIALDPSYTTAYFNLGHSYQGLGRLDEAIENYERMGRPSGNLGNAYAHAGRIDDARAVIAHFEAEYARTGRGGGNIAQVYCGLGDIEQAFEWIERSRDFPGGTPATYRVAAVWDPLRSDPRFESLLKKYGLD